jgi:hypothetical protein
MPCSDGGWGCSRDGEELAQLERRHTLLAQMLCAACQSLQDNGIRIPRNTATWWAEHQEADRRRIQREQETARRASIRASALSKIHATLTPEERAAIGINSQR